MSSLNFHGADRLDPSFLLREDLMTFMDFTFSELYPKTELIHSPHLAVMAAKLQQCLSGTCRRLMILLPPRSGKSTMASVAFPAWALGRYPHKQIVCVSYAQDLADKHARDTRTVMTSRMYQKAFPTRLSRQKFSVNEFYTTDNGFRMATSVGGVLTGKGGDIIIIDDPLKPTDAYSETARVGTNNWYENTLLSRLNNKQEGVIIIVMQRLHQDDLAGHLLEKEPWEVLRFPAIAEEDELHRMHTEYGNVVFRRKAGEVLDPRRESLATLMHLRQTMGSFLFDSQYQQNPQPEGGAIIKKPWLGYYKPDHLPRQFTRKIQSWDTANKSGEFNDFSVCTTWGIFEKRYYLLDVFRKRLEYPELRRAVIQQYHLHKPGMIVMEDKGSGTQLIQDLKREGLNLKAYFPPPASDKQMRLHSQAAVFESGRVLLPTCAAWLDEYVKELITFPGTKHDDQVDSTTQALDYLEKVPQYVGTIEELRL